MVLHNEYAEGPNRQLVSGHGVSLHSGMHLRPDTTSETNTTLYPKCWMPLHCRSLANYYSPCTNLHPYAAKHWWAGTDQCKRKDSE